MMLPLWFALSALAIGLLLIGNFFLMAGAHAFHLVFWIFLALGVWYAVEARRLRGVGGIFGAWLLWGSLALLVPVGSVISGVWLVLQADLENMELPLLLWILGGLILGGIATGYFATSWIPQRAAAAAEEQEIRPGRLRLSAAAFYSSLLTNLVFLLVVVVLLTNYPKEPTFQTEFPFQLGTAEQQAAYREYVRWALKETGEEKAREWYGELTDPTPGVAHPAPVNQALALAAADPGAPLEILSSAFTSWVDPPHPLDTSPTVLAAEQEAREILHQHYRFLIANDPLPPKLHYAMPVPSFLAQRKACQSMNYLIILQVHQGKTKQAVADYLFYGRAAHKAVSRSFSVIDFMIDIAVLNSWMNILPQVLPHMTAEDRDALRALIEDVAQDLPQAQRDAWAAELAGQRSVYQSIGAKGPDVLTLRSVFQLHSLSTPSPTSSPNFSHHFGLAGVLPFLDRLELLLYDPNMTKRESEELMTPMIRSGNLPFSEARPIIDQIEMDIATLIRTNHWARVRNPAGGFLVLTATSPFLRANARAAGTRAKVQMMLYLLDYLESPDAPPSVPIDETSGDPFVVTVSPDGAALTIEFPPTSLVLDAMGDDNRSFTVPLE